MSHHPSGMGDTQFQGDSDSTYGVVVKVDPKDGMCVVRLAEQIGASAVGDDQLSKYSCVSGTDNPQVRGLGTWPPHKLVCGSLVRMRRQSQRGEYVIECTVGATQREDASTQDIPPEGTATSLMSAINALAGGNGTNHVMKQLFGNRNPSEFKSTQEALGFINQTFKTAAGPYKKDPVQEFVKHMKRPKKYGGSPGIKEMFEKTPSTLGGTSYNKGDLQSATKTIKSVLGNKGELIQNSIKMIENAQKATKSGSPVSAINAVGGPKVLAQAIASAMSLFQTAAKGKSDKDKKDQLNSLEELLMRIYEELTGQKALDENGEPTPHYLEWREIYIKGFGDIEEIGTV